MKQTVVFLLFWSLSFNAVSVNAQESPSSILIIYDASGSMWGQMNGVTKKEIGASVLTETVEGFPEDRSIGLLVYGHRNEKDCNDIELIADLENRSKEKITKAIHALTPLGRTPLARSASLAIAAVKESGNSATIILITDGIESCDGDICEVVSAARMEGIDFKLHIVGFGLKDSEIEVLQCAADAGGGRYFSAADADQLSISLQEVTKQTIDDPLENFSVVAFKNNEPVDAWIRAFESETKEGFGGSRTYRDTGKMYLPPGRYDINVKPLENTDITGTTIQVEVRGDEFIHRTISFDGAKLDLASTNNGEGWDSVVKVLEVGTTKAVAGTRTYGRTKTLEVDSGIYDIEFQALIIKGLQSVHKIEGIEVVAGKSFSVMHNFESGSVKIGVQSTEGELIDASVAFTEVTSGKGITAGRTYTSPSNNPKEFILSPGTYQVKIIGLGIHKGNTTILEVIVKAGETTEKIITY